MTNKSTSYRSDCTAELPRGFSPALGSRISVGLGIHRWDWLDNYPWGEKRWSSESVKLVAFDVTSSDRAHWHGIKLFLVWLAQALPSGNRDWAHFAYKALRKQHHDGKVREWDQVLPGAIVKWANGRLAKAAKGELCCDNWRVALKGNTGQVRRYKAAKASGCCGFADFEAVGPDGKTYLLGFNFGH